MSRFLIAVAVSLALHAALAAVPALRGPRAAAAVVVEVQLTRVPRPPPTKPSPPPPRPAAEVPPARRKPAPRPKFRPVQHLVVQRRAASTAEEKPAPEPRPLGVTPSSVAPGGEGPSMPIGSGDGQAGGRGTAPATGHKAAPSTPPAPKAAPARLRARPRLLREHKVGYPEEARRNGIEGTVTLDVLVGEDGRVREVKVISGPGFGLNEAAQRALMRFVFAPAVYSDGKPRAHRIVYRYVFQID